MPTKATEPSVDDLVYLFGSAPPDRPTYKRTVLNILCYPEGHELELSYQRSYFQPSLLQASRPVANRRGAFVFVDYKPESDHEFIPVRFVKILDVAPKEKAETYLDSTRFHVRIELGKLVPPDAKASTKIAALPGRPKPHATTGTGSRGYFYVIEGSDLLPNHSNVSQRDIWDQTTARVAKTKSLNDCVFLWTGHLRPFTAGRPCKLSPYGNEQKAYRIEPNSIYRLDFRVKVYYPNVGPERAVIVRSSSDLLSISQPFATALGAEDHSVLIACKRTIES